MINTRALQLAYSLAGAWDSNNKKEEQKMTADEARKLVDKANKQPKIDKHLYKEAISEIKEAAKDGQYSCGFRLWGSKIKTEAIKKKLELDGYRVTYKYEDPYGTFDTQLEESALFRVSWYPKDYVKKVQEENSDD